MPLQKKSFISIFMAILLFQTTFSLFAVSERVYVNDQEIPLEVLFRDDKGVIFSPLDYLCKIVRARYRYNEFNKVIIVEKGSTALKLQINNTLVINNDKWEYLKAPVQVVDNEIIVPVKHIGEALGAKVQYASPFQNPVSPSREYRPGNQPTYNAGSYYQPHQRERDFTRNYYPRYQQPYLSMNNKLALTLNAGAYRPEGWEVYAQDEDFEILGEAGIKYGLNPHWVIDARYGWFKDFNQRIFDKLGDDEQGRASLELNPTTINLACYWGKNHQLKPYLGIGWLHYDVEYRYTDDDNDWMPANPSQVITDHSDGFHAFGGLEYQFTPKFGINAELRYFKSDIGLKNVNNKAAPNNDLTFDLSDLFGSIGMSIYFK